MTLDPFADLPELPADPRDLQWQLLVITQANVFFSVQYNAAMRKTLGLPVEEQKAVPLTLRDFMDYLGRHGTSPWTLFPKVKRVIERMTHAGHLDHLTNATGTPALGNAYWTMGEGATQAQRAGFLHFSELVGPDLIIREFGAATIPITGTSEDGDVVVGTGLALDERHLLTNAHVVKDMVLDNEFETSVVGPPGMVGTPASVDSWHVRLVKAHVLEDDDATDIAVVEVEPGPEGRGLFAARGVAFRDPEWADQVLNFGYPPVPMSTAPSLVVHHGEVVNPLIQSFHGSPAFLYSAVTRPGNSGGPIVARDGRVVGLVAHDVYDRARPDVAPYYRAIPGSVIRDALQQLGFGDSITWEDWS
ncbi:S1 family peptidase [Prescottella subtropica]|uniref:S1 family peptidase n=1 Tax=Prescottella subtropica TaxID=2545757 RepID=UPI0010F6E8C5|nr:serine protease [Prescottella subtropica]